MTILFDKNIPCEHRDSVHVWAFASDTFGGRVNIDAFERRGGGATAMATVNLTRGQALDLIETLTKAVRTLEPKQEV